MAKQWKQSLEQSDILSDGTPFDGSNIDAPISSAGQGVDWASKTPKATNTRTTAPGGNTTSVLNVSGGGYISRSAFFADDGQTPNLFAELKIDGTVVVSDTLQSGFKPRATYFDDGSNDGYRLDTHSMYRFDSSFTLQFDNQTPSDKNVAAGVEYVID